MMSTRPQKQLSGKQLNALVFKRMRKYDKLNFLENFAMFMGKAQLVELALKSLLLNKYGLEEERIENWPLGQVIGELKARGCRKDFIAFLEDLKEHRNYIAHELLLNDALMRRLAGSKARSFASRSVVKGLYCVETVIAVHDFLISKGFL